MYFKVLGKRNNSGNPKIIFLGFHPPPIRSGRQPQKKNLSENYLKIPLTIFQHPNKNTGNFSPPMNESGNKFWEQTEQIQISNSEITHIQKETTPLVFQYLKEKDDSGKLWNRDDFLMLLESMGQHDRADFYRKQFCE